MKHEHETQGDANRWNRNTRHKVMKIDGTGTQDTYKEVRRYMGGFQAMGYECPVRVSKPYSSEDLGRKDIVNYQKRIRGTKKINK
jgi:hypothetical protein